MATVWKRILDDVAAKLGALGGYSFLDNPNREIENADLPCIMLFDGGVEQAVADTGRDLFTGRFSVAGVVKDPAGGAARRAAMDALFEAVFDALRADVTRGGLAIDTFFTGSDDPVTVTDEGHRALLGQEFAYEVEFWTAEGDPTTTNPGAS